MSRQLLVEIETVKDESDKEKKGLKEKTRTLNGELDDTKIRLEKMETHREKDKNEFQRQMDVLKDELAMLEDVNSTFEKENRELRAFYDAAKHAHDQVVFVSLDRCPLT